MCAFFPPGLFDEDKIIFLRGRVLGLLTESKRRVLMRTKFSFGFIRGPYVHTILLKVTLFLSFISTARADDVAAEVKGLMKATLENTDLKNEPYDDAKTIGRFPQDTLVEILDNRLTEFDKVAIDGIEGYLEKGYSIKWENLEPLYHTSTNTELKSSPQLSSKTLKSLPKFSDVEVLDGFKHVFRKVKISKTDASNVVYRKFNFKNTGFIPSHKLSTIDGELRVHSTTELLSQPDLASRSVGLLSTSNTIEYVDNFLHFNRKIKSGDKIEIQPQVVDANSTLYRKVKVDETIGYLDHNSINFEWSFTPKRAVFSEEVQLKKAPHVDAKVLKKVTVTDKFRGLNHPRESYTKVKIGESVGYVKSKNIQWKTLINKETSKSTNDTTDEKSFRPFNFEELLSTTFAPCVLGTAPLWGPAILPAIFSGGRLDHGPIYSTVGLCSASTIGTTIAVAGLDERNAQAIDFIALNRETLRIELVRRNGEFLSSFFEIVDIHAARREELTTLFAAHQSFLFSDSNARSILRRMIAIANSKPALVKSES